MIDTLFYNTVLTGGIIAVLILFVFLISPALNRRYHAAWRFNVWKVFALFLIIPVGLILRLVVSSERIQSGVTVIKNNAVTPAVPISTEPVSFQMIAENHQVSIWSKLIDVGPQWIPIIWIMGVCIVAVYLLGVYLHFIHTIKNSSRSIQSENTDQIQAEILSRNKRKSPLSMYQCPKIVSPMIAGIIRPAIFIPERDYSEADLKIILTHELTHYMRNDLKFKGMFIFALILHWYNPVVYMMTKAADKDMELCCDQDVIKAKNQKFKADYSEVIMREIISRRQIKGALFACMGSDKKSMEERFKNIFSINKRKGKICFLLALILVTTVSGFVYASDKDTPDFHSQQYKKLLEKIVADKEVDRKAHLVESKSKNVPYKDIDNFEELAARVMDKDGNYDIYEVYALAGMEPPEQVLPDFDLSQFESYFAEVNSCIQPHILGNGERAIYSTNSGEPWKLKKGDIVKLHIFVDIDRLGPERNIDGKKYANRGIMFFGYIKDDERVDIQNLDFTINEEKQIELEIPEDGEYNFYLFCPGSLDIIVKWISIDIK
nr:M56 family metallopeptidase [Aminipila luticellarii]